MSTAHYRMAKRDDGPLILAADRVEFVPGQTMGSAQWQRVDAGRRWLMSCDLLIFVYQSIRGGSPV
jgi:hypothetical protein